MRPRLTRRRFGDALLSLTVAAVPARAFGAFAPGSALDAGARRGRRASGGAPDDEFYVVNGWVLHVDQLPADRPLPKTLADVA